MHHRAKKRFGQNFLVDHNIIDQIVALINPSAARHLVEIGPGQGALTAPMLTKANQLTVVEIDNDLIANLKVLPQQNKLTIIHQDALTVDFNQLAAPLTIVGNLPYNISTPIITKLLLETDHIKEMVFMLQKEVVERMCAAPGTKQYGRLSILCQHLCNVSHCFDVMPECFHPRPKVTSAIVHLEPKTLSNEQQTLTPHLLKLAKQAFSTRRKTLKNNLKPILTEAQIKSVGLDPNCRPETVTLAQYCQLAYESKAKS